MSHSWTELELDVMHLDAVAHLYHEDRHAKQVPNYNDCHAYTCRKAREAVEHLTGLTEEQVTHLRLKLSLNKMPKEREPRFADDGTLYGADPPYRPMKVMS